MTLSINVNSQCLFAINLAGTDHPTYGWAASGTPLLITGCAGASVDLVASNNCSGYRPVYWYTSLPNSSGSNYIAYSQAISVSLVNQTIYARTNNALSSGQRYVNLSIVGYQASKPIINGSNNICNNSTNTTYSGATDWNISNASAGTLINNNNGTCTINWANGFTGVLQLKGRVNSTSTYCGYSDWSDDLIITVNSLPSSPTASNSGITCIGNALSLTASTIAGATYNWTGPNGFTSSLQNPLVSDNATLQMAGTYTVTASVNGCSNTPATTNVIINQATINSNTTVCEGSSLSLSASNISGASYY
ncbi:MAG: hypothetical protein RL308_286 [Bacteroidota bacterium]